MNKLAKFEEYIVGHNGIIRKVSDCTVQALDNKPRLYNAFEVDSFLNDLARQIEYEKSDL